MDKLLEWLDAERGRRIKLAAALSIVPHALSQWQRIPVEHVLKIERYTGVSRHDMRPDIYPREEG
jgi:DNA-binding transcriptional regulator YdaS (Cro superfamily)